MRAKVLDRLLEGGEGTARHAAVILLAKHGISETHPALLQRGHSRAGPFKSELPGNLSHVLS